MPITNRQGPLYFFPKGTKAYRDGYDRIFGKKDKTPASKQAVTKPKKTAPKQDAVDNT